MTWLNTPFAPFDLETTAPNPLEARIVTACLMRIDHQPAATSARNWLLDPGIEIPTGASDIHGVTTERARAEGQNYYEGYAEIRGDLERVWAEGRIVIAYNAVYDLTVIDAEGQRLGEPPLVCGLVIDPFVIDRAVDKFRRGRRTLGVTCEFYGVPLGDDAHSADADALAAARLAWKLAHAYPAKVGNLSIEDLMVAQEGWHQTRQDDYAAYLIRKGEDASGVNGDWPIRRTA